MTMGIYKIENLINGKVYVGSSVDVEKRRYHHFYEMKKGIHKNEYLQRVFDKYGESIFEFFVLEEVGNTDILLEREDFWINSFRANDREFGYNIRKFAENNLGFRHSEESKRKMSESQKGEKSVWWGRTHTEETKLKIGDAQRGEKNHSWGKSPSIETRQKISKANKGRIPSEESRKRMSIAQKGRTVSDEHRRKISKSRIGRFAGENSCWYGKRLSLESKKKMSEAKKGEKCVWWEKKHSEETKLKMGRSQVGKRSRGKNKFIGVAPKNKKFQARISYLNKDVYLGVFFTEEDAARAYNEAARELHGLDYDINKITGE